MHLISGINYTATRYVAKDGQRLVDLYGHLPGYWIHPSLMVATFEKNATKWNGSPVWFVGITRCRSHVFCFRGAH